MSELAAEPGERDTDSCKVSTIVDEYSDCHIYGHDYGEFKLWNAPCKKQGALPTVRSPGRSARKAR